MHEMPKGSGRRLRRSGGGYHVLFVLHEPISAGDADYFERACRALKTITTSLSGDPAPAHPAALLREIGTHNSKRDGEPILVTTIGGSGKSVDLTDVETLIDFLPEAGLFAKLVSKDHEGEDVQSGPVDIDQRLAAMSYEGPGRNALDITQRDTIGALLNRGTSLDEATETVLGATKRAVAGTPHAAGWDWEEEELDIRWKGARLINKDATLIDRLSDDMLDKWRQIETGGGRPILCKNAYSVHVKSARQPDLRVVGGTDDVLARLRAGSSTTRKSPYHQNGW